MSETEKFLDDCNEYISLANMPRHQAQKFIDNCKRENVTCLLLHANNFAPIADYVIIDALIGDVQYSLKVPVRKTMQAIFNQLEEILELDFRISKIYIENDLYKGWYCGIDFIPDFMYSPGLYKIDYDFCEYETNYLKCESFSEYLIAQYPSEYQLALNSHFRIYETDNVFSTMKNLRKKACEEISQNVDVNYLIEVFDRVYTGVNYAFSDCFMDICFARIPDECKERLLKEYLSFFINSCSIRDENNDYIIEYILKLRPDFLDDYADDIASLIFRNTRFIGNVQFSVLGGSKASKYALEFLFDKHYDTIVKHIPFGFYKPKKNDEIIQKQLFSQNAYLIWLALMLFLSKDDILYDSILCSVKIDASEPIKTNIIRTMYILHACNNTRVDYSSVLFQENSSDTVKIIETIQNNVHEAKHIFDSFKSNKIKSDWNELCFAIIIFDNKELYFKIDGQWSLVTSTQFVPVSHVYIEQELNQIKISNYEMFYYSRELESEKIMHNRKIHPSVLSVLIPLANENQYRITVGVAYNDIIAIEDTQRNRIWNFFFFEHNFHEILKKENLHEEEFESFATKFLIGNSIEALASELLSISKIIGFDFIFNEIQNDNHNIIMHLLVTIIKSYRTYDETISNTGEFIKELVAFIDKTSEWRSEYSLLICSIIENRYAITDITIIELVINMINNYLSQSKVSLVQDVICCLNYYAKSESRLNDLLNSLDCSFTDVIKEADECIIPTIDSNSDIFIKCVEAIDNESVMINYSLLKDLMDKGMDMLYIMIFNAAARNDERIFDRLTEMLYNIVSIYNKPRFIPIEKCKQFIGYMTKSHKVTADKIGIKYYENESCTINRLPIEELTEKCNSDDIYSSNIDQILESVIFYDSAPLIDMILSKFDVSESFKKKIDTLVIKYHSMNIFNHLGMCIDEPLAIYSIKCLTSHFFYETNERVYHSKNALRAALHAADFYIIIKNISTYNHYKYESGSLDAVQHLGLFCSTTLATYFFNTTNKTDKTHKHILEHDDTDYEINMETMQKLRFKYNSNSCYIDALMQCIFHSEIISTDIFLVSPTCKIEEIIALYQIYALESITNVYSNIIREYLNIIGFVDDNAQSEIRLLLGLFIDESAIFKTSFESHMTVKKYNMWIAPHRNPVYELLSETIDKTTTLPIEDRKITGDFLVKVGYGPNYTKNKIGIDLEHSFVTSHAEYFAQEMYGVDIIPEMNVTISFVRYELICLIIHSGEDSSAGHFWNAFPVNGSWMIVDGLKLDSFIKKDIELFISHKKAHFAIGVYHSLDTAEMRANIDRRINIINLHDIKHHKREEKRNLICDFLNDRTISKEKENKYQNNIPDYIKWKNEKKEFKSIIWNTDLNLIIRKKPLFKLTTTEPDNFRHMCITELKQDTNETKIKAGATHEDIISDDASSSDACPDDASSDDASQYASSTDDTSTHKESGVNNPLNLIPVENNVSNITHCSSIDNRNQNSNNGIFITHMKEIIFIPDIYIEPSPENMQVIEPFPSIYTNCSQGIKKVPIPHKLDAHMPNELKYINDSQYNVYYPSIFICIPKYNKEFRVFIPASFVWFVFEPHTSWIRINSTQLLGYAVDLPFDNYKINEATTDPEFYSFVDTEITKSMQKGNSLVTKARMTRIIRAYKKQNDDIKTMQDRVISKLSQCSVAKLLIENIVNKSKVKKTNGMKYSREFKYFWLKNQYTNPEVTTFLREHFQGPARSTSQLWHKEFFAGIPPESSWKNIDKVEDTIAFWCDVLKINSLNCIIAIDAMHVLTRIVIDNYILKGVVDEVKVSQEIYDFFTDKINFNKAVNALKANGSTTEAEFVVMLVPLSRCCPLPIHFHPKNNGNASANEVEILEKISDVINARFGDKIHVCGKSTDGDRQYSALEMVFAENFYEAFKKNNYSLAMTIKAYNIGKMVNADLPHLLKRLRNSITGKETTTAFSKVINIEDMKEKIADVLRFDTVFDDKSKFKMDDSMPRELFTPAVIIKIITEEYYDYIPIMLPATLLRMAFYNDQMKRKDRQFALAICFYYMIFIKLNYTTSSFMFQAEQVTDCINLVCHMLKIIQSITDEMSIERCGTLCLEHFFSYVRKLSENEDTAIRTEQSIMKLIASTSLSECFICEKREGYARPAYLEKGICILSEEVERQAKMIAAALILISNPLATLEPYIQETFDYQKNVNDFLSWIKTWPDPIIITNSSNRRTGDQKNRQAKIDSIIHKSCGIGATIKEIRKKNEKQLKSIEVLEQIMSSDLK